MRTPEGQRPQWARINSDRSTATGPLAGSTVGDVMDRRTVVGTGTALGVLSTAYWFFGRDGKDSAAPGGVKEAPKEVEKNPSFTRPFEGKNANDVAERLGITAGNFWMTEPRVMTAINHSSGFLTEKEMLPVFPPAILKHKKEITEAAREVGVPVNIAATISSIESAGKVDAGSNAKARGLFQVVPRFHLDKIVEVARERGFDIPNADRLLETWQHAVDKNFVDFNQDVLRALEDPFIGAKVGMMILKGDHDRLVQRGKFRNSDPVGWAHAMGAYNGGPGRAGSDYLTWPTESQLYVVHGMRHIMTIEVAAQLRKMGLSDPEIAREVISKETDARAYAYKQEVAAGRIGARAGVQAYEAVWRELAREELQGRVKESRDSYLRGEGTYKYPAAPGLRMHLVHGGSSLFLSVPENTDLSKYPANQ